MSDVPAWMLELQQMESAIEVKKTEAGWYNAKAVKVTAWIGGLPRQLAADETALHTLLRRFGELEKTTVRIKEGPYKSWCLATFHNLDAIERLTQEPVIVDPELGEEQVALYAQTEATGFVAWNKGSKPKGKGKC